jgi:hypothetical protein
MDTTITIITTVAITALTNDTTLLIQRGCPTTFNVPALLTADIVRIGSTTGIGSLKRNVMAT